ncbi:hypothetical protein AC1031_012488 [Aphanomyces cochlioides]|nr:hypothetical protein AC1031_014529 [Aphanomyces cochlioides]KAG9398479.1 hypothetical protein AC1031_014532 [Aphanomyces cochlioides]KAG9399053.1 hypothetical protein AC1031_012488 [Aphanomyces cochlioides]
MLEPRFKAGGGKGLRAEGWNHVLNMMRTNGSTFTSKDQLVNKWKRLKTEYQDYHFLITRSGYGDGFSDDQWEALDVGRSAKKKLSRFKDLPFLHYDAISVVLGDAMATKKKLSRFKDLPFLHYDAISEVLGDAMACGESLGSVSDVLEVSSSGLAGSDSTIDAIHDERAPTESDSTTGNDYDQREANGSLDAAQRRASILNKLKRSRKRKLIEDDAVSKLRIEATTAIKDISNSLKDLVKIYAMRSRLQDIQDAQSSLSNNDNENAL